MDLLYIWYDNRFWSKILYGTIPITACDQKVTDLEITLVNQKALVVAARLWSRLFNALEWAKNGGKGKQKIYLLLL